RRDRGHGGRGDVPLPRCTVRRRPLGVAGRCAAMGLSQASLALAARHAHVLVVEVPGWARTRMVVERAVLRRGWQLAQSPADADVLIVCGTPGPRLSTA